MDKIIRLKVLTNEGVAVETEATSVVAPGEKGSFGMLYNHAPLITTLEAGILRWQPLAGGAEQRVNVGSGILEVVKNQVTLLVSSYSPQKQAKLSF